MEELKGRAERASKGYHHTGADPGVCVCVGGGGSWGSGPSHFGGPPNFIKREKTLRTCAQKRHVLVLNSYPDPQAPFQNPVSAPATGMVCSMDKPRPGV